MFEKNVCRLKYIVMVFGLSFGALLHSEDQPAVDLPALASQENIQPEQPKPTNDTVVADNEIQENLAAQEQLAQAAQQRVSLETQHQTAAEVARKEEQDAFDKIAQLADARKLQLQRLQAAQEVGCALAGAWRILLNDAQDVEFAPLLQAHVAFLQSVMELPTCRKVDTNTYAKIMLTQENLPVLRIAANDVPAAVTKLSTVVARRLAEVEKNPELLAAYLNKYEEPLLVLSREIELDAQKMIRSVENRSDEVDEHLKERALPEKSENVVQNEPEYAKMREIQQQQLPLSSDACLENPEAHQPIKSPIV